MLTMSRDVLHAFSPTLKCKASGCYKKLSLVTGLAGRVVKEAFIYDVYLENCSLYRLGLTDWPLRLMTDQARGKSNWRRGKEVNSTNSHANKLFKKVQKYHF